MEENGQFDIQVMSQEEEQKNSEYRNSLQVAPRTEQEKQLIEKLKNKVPAQEELRTTSEDDFTIIHKGPAPVKTGSQTQNQMADLEKMMQSLKFNQ